MVAMLWANQIILGKKTYADGTVENIDLPKTNAFKLHLENGDWICVRPSGTEPKLKCYLTAPAPSASAAKPLLSALEQGCSALLKGPSDA